MSELRIWCTILVIAGVTASIRFAPFVLFGGKRKPPAVLDRLGKVLPYAVMGMLVVYCLRETQVLVPESFFPTLIACLVTGGLHVWRRNTLLSIIAGTLCYMFLVQGVF